SAEAIAVIDHQSNESQADQRLHVDDFAAPDHLAGVGEGERSGLYVLVLVLSGRLGCDFEAGEPEENHLLVAVARRRKERSKPYDGLRDHADFLVTLSAGGDFRLLSGGAASRAQVP